VTIDSVTANVTVTGTTSGGTELPFFTDGNTAFTGAFTAAGSQSAGLAGRIQLNAALATDPSLLVKYAVSGISAADPTRPNFILDRLTNGQVAFAPNTGIGTVASPFTGTIGGFMRQAISQQGEAASTADALKQGQDVVLASLQQRFSDGASVNIDQEMTDLLNLQNAYAANARVMSAVKDMLDMLMRM